MGINKVILVGHVGKDPEVRRLENGTSVANFTLATNESYKNKQGEKVESTEWHNIVIWRKLAEVVEQYVKKGTMLYLEGKVTTRKWQDKDNNDRYTTEIVCHSMEMLSKTEQSNNISSETAPPHQEDDLPW